MHPTSSHSVSLALTRLRRAVIVCCWIIGFALFTQLIIWSLITFTDIRFTAEEEAAEVEAAPLVVHADAQRTHRPRNGRESETHQNSRAEVEQTDDAAAPVRALAPADRTLHGIVTIVGAAGRAAMAILIPLMGVGLVLVLLLGPRGADGTATAFIWCLLLALLVLPLGDSLQLPWTDGALASYEQLAHAVDEARQRPGTEKAAPTAPPSGTLVFYTRCAIAPIACIVGIALIGLRFAAGVEAGILRKESMRLDPTLEREAANITPTSLHGGPRSKAVSAILGKTESDSVPGATQVSPGVMPKRLI